MTKVFGQIILITVLGMIVSSCENNPKGISISGNSQKENNPENPSALADDVHKVKAEEVLYTNQYSYVNVEENGKKYWIASLKQEIKIGEMYTYRDGMLQVNFESKEFNRTFDTLYLVSNLLPIGQNHAHASPDKQDNNKKINASPRNIEVKGSVKIADLVANPGKYEGQTIQISGECTKINIDIMDLNWIHLKDGSKDDFDLVITSNEIIAKGQVVTMTGTVTLNKDFGAGYSYEIIMENGKIAQ